MPNGFYQPNTGAIEFDVRDITLVRPSASTALGVARTFHNIALFIGLTVIDNIMLGRHVRMRASVLSSFNYSGRPRKETDPARRCQGYFSTNTFSIT